MLRNSHCATRFNEIHYEAEGASRSTQPTDWWSWPTARVLRIIGGALRDAFAAHRRYEHLKWRGLPSDTALRQALGISDPASGADVRGVTRPQCEWAIDGRTLKITIGGRMMRASHRHVPTYGGIHREPQSPALSRRLHATKLYTLAGIIGAWLDRSRQRRALAELDDRLLSDIGLTRSEARSEAAKPFWCAGKA